MASIKLGALAQDVRGSLNGTVFSKNRGGAYTRTKVSPTQPRTSNQTNQRAVFTGLAKAWGTTLSPAQRLAWITWAQAHPVTNIFGDAIILSGIAAFQQINRLVTWIFATTDLDAPDGVTPLDSGGFAVATIVTASGVPTITLTPHQSPGIDDAVVLYMTPPLSPGRTPQTNQYRLISKAGNVSTISTVPADYLAYYRITKIPVGCKIALRMMYINPTGGRNGPVAVTIQSTGT